MENDSPEVILAHHAPQLPEDKKGNENANDHDRATQQVVETNLMKGSGSVFSMNQVLDHLLMNVESEDKPPKRWKGRERKKQDNQSA